MASNKVDPAKARFDLGDEAPIALLWALRVIKHCGPSNRVLKHLDHHFSGIHRLLVGEGCRSPKSVEELKMLVDARLEAVESEVTELPPAFARNIALLGERTGLSDTERRVLAARALYRVSEVLQCSIDTVTSRTVTDGQIAQVIGAAIHVPRQQVADALAAEGTLRKVGLLELRQVAGTFDFRLGLLPGLANALQQECDDIDKLLSFALTPAAAALLGLDAYPHLEAELELVLGLLRGRSAASPAGINILFHGPPGTGKTELARAIATACGLNLFEVTADTGLAGGAAAGGERFRNYRFLQQLLSSTPDALLVFDEIEDVFPVPRPAEGKQVIAKAEICRVLESNPVPAFWISNQATHIDPAILRRFDLIVEINSPPRSIRRRLLEAALGDTVTDHPAIEQIASNPNLTPAVLSRSARVVRLAGYSGSDAADRLDTVLHGFRDATDQSSGSNELRLPRHFDLAFINATERLDNIRDALASRGRGRVLLHGPPGTGKTAFAHFVARALDRPLLLRRAADIFSPWLGESERNARRMFQAAERESAVLLLDEADSVLRDRAAATSRWEGPVVTEILTGMERFDGVFLCATNLLETLDSASLRRFTFKVGFRWLTREQRWQLLLRTFPELASNAGPKERADAQAGLDRLDCLAPGDFSVVADRSEVDSTLESLAAAVDALAAEQGYKPPARKAIGF